MAADEFGVHKCNAPQIILEVEGYGCKGGVRNIYVVCDGTTKETQLYRCFTEQISPGVMLGFPLIIIASGRLLLRGTGQ